VTSPQKPFVIPQRRSYFNKQPSSPTFDRVQKLRSAELKRKAGESDEDASDTANGSSTIDSSKPQVVTKTTPSSSRSTRYDGEIDALTEAMAEMRVFQNIPASPYESIASEYDRTNRSAITSDGKSTKPSGEVSREGKDVKVAGAETGTTKQEEAKRSQESFSSLEDDFELVEVPTSVESEHNGASRDWYKGFVL
jgi:hypothetical protein